MTAGRSPPPTTGAAVLASLESEDGGQCVDFFIRPDGSFGFEQYRREYDGQSGWQCLSKYARQSFVSGQEALRVAKQQVPWLGRSEVWRW